MMQNHHQAELGLVRAQDEQRLKQFCLKETKVSENKMRNCRLMRVAARQSISVSINKEAG